MTASAPPPWQELLTAAEEAWDDDRIHDALQLCDRAALTGVDGRHRAALLRGHILLDLGDAAGALSSFESVADPGVPDPELDCARGIALFELARFAEAENALQSSLRGNADLADAHYALGLIAELHGSGQEVEHFRRARRLAPERFPNTPKLSTEDFEGMVEEALTGLPQPVREAMENIPVLVAEVPHPEDLKEAEPPLSPQSFGMFVGLSPAAGGMTDESGQGQTGILLFKRNLERACPDRETLVEEIRETVLHEVSHALGLPIDDMDPHSLN